MFKSVLSIVLGLCLVSPAFAFNGRSVSRQKIVTRSQPQRVVVQQVVAQPVYTQQIIAQPVRVQALQNHCNGVQQLRVIQPY